MQAAPVAAGGRALPQHLIACPPARTRWRRGSRSGGFSLNRQGTHLVAASCGSRRITGVRNLQAGAGIAVLRPLTPLTIRARPRSPSPEPHPTR